MAIRTSPKGKPSGVPALAADDSVTAFIDGGSKRPEGSKKRAKRVAISHRVDSSILEAVDVSARRAGLTRSAWINLALAEKLGRAD